MTVVLRREIDRVSGKRDINVVLIDQAVDFFRTYSDRTHHGKEEEILFRDLLRKPLSPEHRQIVDELIEDHKKARKAVGQLVEAKDQYLKDGTGVDQVLHCLGSIADFYPGHIEKEDKHFFFPCLDYFSQEEQDTMLREFYEFDRNMIHEKYRGVVEAFLGQSLLKFPGGK